MPLDGIAITISADMLKEKGYRNWLRNFLRCMSNEGCVYYMRVGARPRLDEKILYVYLVIGNKVRYRAYYAGAQGPSLMRFTDGKEMYARAWIRMAGPVERPKVTISMKGFRGFRYVENLF